MNKKKILEVIKHLAASQGYYSRLYDALMKASEKERNEWLDNIVALGFEDPVDLVLYLEG